MRGRIPRFTLRGATRATVLCASLGLAAPGWCDTAQRVDSMTPATVACNLEAYPAIDCVADSRFAAVLVERHLDRSRTAAMRNDVAFASPAFDSAQGTAKREALALEQSGPPLPPFLGAEPWHGAPAGVETPATRPGASERRHRIRRGETLSTVLSGAGISTQETEAWLRATRRVYNLNRLYIGQTLTLDFDRERGGLRRLTLDIDDATRIVATREAGEIAVREEQIPRTRRLRLIGGVVRRSLYASASALGTPDRIISDMAEILGWELNLATELQPGATFRVVYEELLRSDTLQATPGRVLAVEVVSAGRTAAGYYFGEQDGAHRVYYDRGGEALGRAFLRYPVTFSRVSSQFSRARFHPVLKRHQAHNGVDFAAPQGTPVTAVADGSIARAGWQGSYGRYIKIRHDGIYGSGYAHLSRIAAGVVPGARVQKGQVIGYVGASGRATGPHLHFEMYRHDQYINPLTADLPRGRSLSGGSLTWFRTALALLDGAYGEIDGQYASGPRDDTSEPALTQVAQATGFVSR